MVKRAVRFRSGVAERPTVADFLEFELRRPNANFAFKPQALLTLKCSKKETRQNRKIESNIGTQPSDILRVAVLGKVFWFSKSAVQKAVPRK